MKNIAIIAEYNPLHNGHLYQMNKVGLDNNIVVALSGNFTERGDIAVQNKYTRAEFAVKYGASMVIEIPTFGVLSCAEHYAKCAVKSLSLLNFVDELCFGSENGDIETLKKIAHFEENKCIKDEISSLLDSGESYPKALSLALSKHSNIRNIDEILSKPNNVLGIEYIRALNNTNITPTTIKRIGNEYNDTCFDCDNLASATSIRNNLSHENVSKYLPLDVLNSMKSIEINENILFYNLYQKLIVDKVDIKNILNVGEGIDNRIRDSLKLSSTYENLLSNIKTKRYTLSRIKRTLLDILLGIDKNMVSDIDSINYIHVLAIRRDKLHLLKNIDANIVTKYNDYKNLDNEFSNLDLKANDLYNLVSQDKVFHHQMIIVD